VLKVETTGLSDARMELSSMETKRNMSRGEMETIISTFDI
jgi:hypothetical protein